MKLSGNPGFCHFIILPKEPTYMLISNCGICEEKMSIFIPPYMKRKSCCLVTLVFVTSLSCQKTTNMFCSNFGIFEENNVHFQCNYLKSHEEQKKDL